MVIRNINSNNSTYDTTLDLFINYFQNPIVRNRSRNQLEKIRVSANETKRTAVKNVHLDLLKDLPNLDIFEFALYLDEETIATARNMQADLDHIGASDIIQLVLCQV